MKENEKHKNKEIESDVNLFLLAKASEAAERVEFYK